MDFLKPKKVQKKVKKSVKKWKKSERLLLVKMIKNQYKVYSNNLISKNVKNAENQHKIIRVSVCQ